MDNFAFTPANGFLDSAAYPNPNSETETREQLFSLHKQTRDFINANLTDAVTSDTVVKIKANATGFSYSTDGTNYTVIEGSSSGQGDMYTSVYDTDADGIVDNAELVNGHTVNSDVPANAVFTDTVYDDTELRTTVSKMNGAYTLIDDDVSPNGGTITLPTNYNEYLFIVNGQWSSASNGWTAVHEISYEALKLLSGKASVPIISLTASGSSDRTVRVSYAVTRELQSGAYVVSFIRSETTYKALSVEVYGR